MLIVISFFLFAISIESAYLIFPLFISNTRFFCVNADNKKFIRHFHQTPILKMMDIDDPYDPFSDLAGDGYPDNGGPLDNQGRPMTPYRECLEGINSNYNETWNQPLDYGISRSRQDVC